jgi:hypothetical protein
VAETPEYELIVHAAADDLDRNLAFRGIIGANSPIDRAHSTLSDLFDQAIGSGEPAHERVNGCGECLESRAITVGAVEKLVACIFIRGKQLCYFFAEGGIFPARVLQVRRAPRGFQFQRGVKEFFDPLPAFRIDWLWPG